MWVIVQNGYRATDGSTTGYGKTHSDPTRKLMAVCRTEAGVGGWLRRLKKWAHEGVETSGRAALIPTYEVVSVDNLADLGPAKCVGREFYGDHGRAESLRKMLLNVRESHAALRQEYRRRKEARA